jgi:hypothetical protein
MTWARDTVEGLFGKIRDTMPPNFGTVVGDQAKLDVVAYILQTNGYPAGSTELLLDSRICRRARSSRRVSRPRSRTFPLVQTVGACREGRTNKWMPDDAPPIRSPHATRSRRHRRW